MRRAPCLIVWAAVLSAGCDIQFVAPVKPTPNPIKVEPKVYKAVASDSLRQYGLMMADVFDKSASQFRQHTPSSKILKDMGDGLVPARVDSFMPLMQKLNELRPSPGATDAQRNAADEARAVVLEQWAKQLRGEK